MRTSKAKYRLWQIMLAIAVLAGLFAAFGVTFATTIVFMIGMISLPLLLAGPGRRVQAMVWISSTYPFLILTFLYATWLAAWCVLGHSPRPYWDDPDRLSPIVNGVGAVSLILLTVGTPLIWFLCAPLIIAGVYWNMAQWKTSPWKGALQVLAPACAWLSGYAILEWDPYHVLTWYID
jgi:hypothetical protein